MVASAIAMCHEQINFRLIFRVAFHFAIFQAGLLLLGWLIGSAVGEFMGGYDHWIAAVLLWLIGGKMLWEACHADDQSDECKVDPSRGWSLVFLSIATSIDALAVGGSLGFLQAEIKMTVVLAWILTVMVAACGLFIGRKAVKIVGKWAEIGGGVILILIGVKVLLQHLMALG